MGNPYAPDIQKMDQIVMNSVDKDAINTQQSPASPVVRLSPVSLDAICLDGNQCSNFKHADPYSFRHGVASASPPHYPINEFIMQSQYITIWLDHNSRLDDYFEFPTINWTIPQLSDHKGQSSSQDWYFQDSLKISG